MPLITRPKCSCGELMFEIGTSGAWTCMHCDGPCHVECNDQDCKEPKGKCTRCNSFEVGSRPKGLAGYRPRPLFG